jgi:hypothetical protein
MNTDSLSTVAATLANGGICPTTGERVFSSSTVQKILALMFSCGMYDYSGQYAFICGIPSKSGVSGIVMMVVPGVAGFAVWSPRLDKYGNSVRGIAFANELTKRFNFHNFDKANANCEESDGKTLTAKLNPCANNSYTKSVYLSNYLFAAAEGNLHLVRQMLLAKLVPVNAADYDKRTALHLAASEGRLEMAKLLVSCGHATASLDRYSNTPLMDAERAGYTEVAKFLRSLPQTIYVRRLSALPGPGASPNKATGLPKETVVREEQVVHVPLSAIGSEQSPLVAFATPQQQAGTPLSPPHIFAMNSPSSPSSMLHLHGGHAYSPVNIQLPPATAAPPVSPANIRDLNLSPQKQSFFDNGVIEASPEKPRRPTLNFMLQQQIKVFNFKWRRPPRSRAPSLAPELRKEIRVFTFKAAKSPHSLSMSSDMSPANSGSGSGSGRESEFSESAEEREERLLRLFEKKIARRRAEKADGLSEVKEDSGEIAEFDEGNENDVSDVVDLCGNLSSGDVEGTFPASRRRKDDSDGPAGGDTKEGFGGRGGIGG